MSNNQADRLITDIDVLASREDILRTLSAQYAHLDGGEARTILERLHASVWTNEELLDIFEVSHFAPPYVHVIRKEDSTRGTVAFIDAPRLYFSFCSEAQPDEQRTA